MNPLRNLKCAWVLLALLIPLHARGAPSTQPTAEQWGVFELVLHGPSSGNPFVDVELSAHFTCEQKAVDVRGFYDGDGTYRIRFMPEKAGRWHYQTQSNRDELSSQSGDFDCVAPSTANHGPVRVHNTYHFAYADGTPYIPIGTTCYGWVQEPDDRQDRTLATLKDSPFNKIRMCVLPTQTNPVSYPYARDRSGKFDPMRFDVAYFRNLEKRIAQLGAQGVEADLILFHPYKKAQMDWFDAVDVAGDDRYLHYVVARLSAYRNVWWSLANEYGQVRDRTDADWDHFFQLIAAEDPYSHLRSIHNAAKFYDSNKPWVMHASIQNGSAVADFGRAVLYRELWHKPIVYDEVCYEGNISARWGQLTPQEMVERFWLGTIAGTYVGHSETYPSSPGVAWLSRGDKLVGQSVPRIAFLKKILEAGPADGVEPIDEMYETHIGGKGGEYYLVYFGKEQPKEWSFELPRNPPTKAALAIGMKFKADVLDTWNMTITPVDGQFTTTKLVGSIFHAEGEPKIALPAKPYMALRIQRVEK